MSRSCLTPQLEQPQKPLRLMKLRYGAGYRIKNFHAAYMNFRRESVRQSIARLQQASSEAVNTLRTITKDKNAPANARVTAAKAIIEYSMKAVELEDLAERVAQLEAIQTPKQGRR